MNILFRVDSNKNIGAGHAMRCIALAEECLVRNFNVSFIFQSQLDFVLDILTKKGINQITLPQEIANDDEIKTIKAALNSNDILILDGYQFDADYQKKIKEYGIKICYITDFPVEHCADMLVCPTPGLTSEQFKTDGDCKYLLGVEYVFLRDEIINCKRNFVPEPRQNIKIIVAFGASFFELNIIGKFVNLFDKYFQKIDVNFIIGVNSAEEELNQLFSGRLNKYSYTTAKNFTVEMIANADLALTPASTMFWEFNYFGVPAIVFYTADNQKGNAEWLDNNSITVSVGNLNNFDEKKIYMTIQAYILNIINGYRVNSIIDGNGKKLLTDCFEIKIK